MRRHSAPWKERADLKRIMQGAPKSSGIEDIRIINFKGQLREASLASSSTNLLPYASKNEFVVKDEDVITLSYPKSGTNWLLEIICLIHSRGDPSWIQSVVTWDHSPWLEIVNGYEKLRNHTPEKGPRFYISHLPIQFFPKSFFSSKAKAIYIIGNPRDIIASGYFFFGKE
ncbi:sulfotransferase 2A1-like [Dasypus novemcinctus]|uniref:sulfotransferase 2A1-like n=1 Tax=Dasypus novemcinctus TaxID=9361 RepID=UPI00265DD0D5|nr:sulfotransferase 2A1-like [Dasypus novemcinctus]XP_058136872.1 sulfotransferase 2A1-like [Dasypus novemcinctus]